MRRVQVNSSQREIAQLKARLSAIPTKKNNWVERIAGTFANDPIFEEAVRLGRKWRKSDRPKARPKTRIPPASAKLKAK
jgi:phage-related baseplate assembly protein